MGAVSSSAHQQPNQTAGTGGETLHLTPRSTLFRLDTTQLDDSAVHGVGQREVPDGNRPHRRETGLAEVAESNATLADWIRHGRAADPVGTLSGPECRCHQ